MSHSFKKTPVIGITTCKSEKQDKRIWNRRFRHRAKQYLLIDRALPMNIKKETETWDGGKDGKFRFDPYKFPDYMRK